MKIAAAIALLCAPAAAGTAERILFVGNSFTFGAGSAVKTYRPDLVHDLNRDGVGGVPALFKRFAEQAAPGWDVSLETASGQDFAFHLANKRPQLAGAWDVVVLQDYSTLDKVRPGDPAAHVRDAARLATMFKTANPRVRVLLETTWSRADLTYPAGTPWRGKPIRAMTDDIARGNALAIAANGELFAGTLPVGEAWLRAMDQGVADPNPYDGIAFGKIDLWTWDHYHASAAGYYLAALVIFGRVTGVDPRTLGTREKAADEIGLSPATAVTLQRIAAEELSNASGTRAGR
ncbi:PEP-CTERM sorting domain-containing protein [Sphingomonas crusticola]|uniref:PEP-CTERM sorting domain-containing protein n=1 Tax=Sphingomonas crusticola TaxID=1697973 RepID=UPI001F073B40|nr:PEP-CTERM sorting domain-containing protein [Sphingomonas crusticola]